MAKKSPPLDLEEENAEREKYAGMTKEEILEAASSVRTQKRKSAELSGDLSGKLEIFTKKGGHKSALKQAEKIADMEPAECADWMRAFLAYFDALGGNDQLDMFESQREQSLNAENVETISKSKSKEVDFTADEDDPEDQTMAIVNKLTEPQQGAEPSIQ